jgi:hypothetical protein
VQQHKSKTGMERGKLFKFIFDNFIEFPWHKFTGGILDLSIDMQDT